MAPRAAFTSEDFAFMLQRCPGAYLWLGQGRSNPGPDGERATPAMTSTTTGCHWVCAGCARSPSARSRDEAFFSFHTPTMSITALRQSATIAGLQDQGTPADPQSLPSCRLRGIDVELPGAGGNKSGIRECGPGRFERPLPNAEVMHILAGFCSFTPTGGQALQIRAADTLLFPAYTTGRMACARPALHVVVKRASAADALAARPSHRGHP